jgi:molybdopterin molybdotransferase
VFSVITGSLFNAQGSALLVLSSKEDGVTEFLHVITADQLMRLLGRFARLSSQRIPLEASLNRILAKDLLAPEDLPEQARSTVDGFAVRAEDTFGASEANPALLALTATVPMGVMPDFDIHPGQAAQISTGGFLPRGTDAVVMIEYTNAVDSKSIEVTRPVTIRMNVIERGEDAQCGEILIRAGRSLRPQEVGFLAALGITDISVFKCPRVAVISSGDEIIPVSQKPEPGQIRDANGYALSALVRTAGAEPIPSGIVPDDAGMLAAAISRGLTQADVVAISGGSSVGTRDLMVEVISGLPGAEILAHGVSIRPGKPTLLANQKGKAIFGLPGHPVSALIVAQVFLVPFLLYLQGGKLEMGPLEHTVEAKLATSIHSVIGLEEFVRVRLESTPDGGYVAHPIFGKSGMLSTMVKAGGIIRIPMNTEGFFKGDLVPVINL